MLHTVLACAEHPQYSIDIYFIVCVSLFQFILYENEISAAAIVDVNCRAYSSTLQTSPILSTVPWCATHTNPFYLCDVADLRFKL